MRLRAEAALVAAVHRLPFDELAREVAQDQEVVARLAAGLPLPQLHLPYLFNADIGPNDVDSLARSLLDGIGAMQEARR